jgi:hypothetical protein
MPGRKGKNGFRSLARALRTAVKPRGRVQPRKQRQPKKKKSSRKFKQGRIMPSSFDPRDCSIIPSTKWEGECVPVTTTVRDIITTDPANFTLYCVNNSGDSSTCGLIVSTSAVPVYTLRNTARLQQIGPAGGPTSGRAMRAGVEVNCTTAPLNANGTVHVLVTDSRLTIDGQPGAGATQAGWLTLISNITTHPDCRHYSAAEFMSTRLFFSRPRNQTDYEDWAGWQGSTLTLAQYSATFLDWNGWTGRSFPMSAIYVVFEPLTVTTAYNVTPLMQYMTRWDAGNVMSTTHRISPTTDQRLFDDMAHHAHAVGPNGTTTTGGPSIIKSFAGGVHSHLASVAGAIGSASAQFATQKVAQRIWSSRAGREMRFPGLENGELR